MQQAADFGAESAALATDLARLAPEDWTRPTGFKGWTPSDILVHLHFWNMAQDRALTDPDGFRADLETVVRAVAEGQGRAAENARVKPRGAELLETWRTRAAEMAVRWRTVDPKARVPWVGPDMSARSAMTARQMETWAHGLAIYDLMGWDRVEHDRLRNVVHLGVSAFSWSFHVQGLAPPEHMPFLRLTAPSGEIWTYGDPAAEARIEGAAADFAKVVTQTRNIADTSLAVSGPVAELWMRRGQCFAGPRETPPPPGTRFRRDNG